MNKEEIKEYNKKYREKNREKLKEYEKKRYIQRKEKMKEYKKRPEVKARINASHKTLKFKAYLKQYRQRPEVKAKRRNYLERTREQTNATARKYLKSHPQMIEYYKGYRKNIRQEFLSTYKKSKCCELCGYNEYPEILQFHHINKKNKSFDIANKVRTLSALKVVKSEVDKCILLCPNCHSWLHFNEHKKKI